MEKEILEIGDVAALLNITVAGLRKLLREGRGPRFFRVGRLIRFRRGDINYWIERNVYRQTGAPDRR